MSILWRTKQRDFRALSILGVASFPFRLIQQGNKADAEWISVDIQPRMQTLTRDGAVGRGSIRFGNAQS
jgi:hypothetical protein